MELTHGISVIVTNHHLKTVLLDVVQKALLILSPESLVYLLVLVWELDSGKLRYMDTVSLNTFARLKYRKLIVSKQV